MIKESYLSYLNLVYSFLQDRKIRRLSNYPDRLQFCSSLLAKENGKSSNQWKWNES